MASDNVYEELDAVSKEMFAFGRPQLPLVTVGSPRTFLKPFAGGLFLGSKPFQYGARLSYTSKNFLKRDIIPENSASPWPLTWLRKDFSIVSQLCSDKTLESTVSWQFAPSWILSAYSFTTDQPLKDSVFTGSLRYTVSWLNSKLSLTSVGITHFNFLLNLKRWLPSIDLGAEAMWNSVTERPGLSLGMRYRKRTPTFPQEESSTTTTSTSTTTQQLPRQMLPFATEYLATFGYLGILETSCTQQLHPNVAASARYSFNLFSFESETTVATRVRYDVPFPWYLKARASTNYQYGLAIGAFVSGIFTSFEMGYVRGSEPTFGFKLEL